MEKEPLSIIPVDEPSVFNFFSCKMLNPTNDEWEPAYSKLLLRKKCTWNGSLPSCLAPKLSTNF
ncbi:hypothetical protein SOMG_04241 [Schizosaccharomyces osmophilus]|uniref:Uncharacterized protein n=1 Tax=Schizosaccharomyces osmophilus TaxID=2545709 RepID=A0AAE9WF90_9SCHI|nr:uncharacterized protein SOMG_04241 [Schizosaccharomyces osmophilus]WBW75326.1 hypothetical protein SOMG_04241 [Schizosaccharomyces osmophilus]